MLILRSRISALAILALALLPGGPAQAQKTTPSYTFTDLGGLPGLPSMRSQARAINDAGQIVGSSYTAAPKGYEFHPVLWAKDSAGKYVITDLNPIAAIRGHAEGINSQGEVVGSWSDPTTGAWGGFLIRPVTVNGVRVWYRDLDLDGHNDLMTDLGQVSGSGPLSVSDNTQMAAGTSVVQFDPNTGNQIVTTLPNGGECAAINNNRQVAGSFGTQAALWQVDSAGNVQSVITLAPLPGNPGCVGKCINALGQVAGSSYMNSGLGSVAPATLWQNGASPTDLGSLGNHSTSDALGISTVNGVLQVVGWADITNHGLHAFLWRDGVATDLNSLISASGFSLQQATAINTQGQIVGVADVQIRKSNLESHAFLLTPK